MIGWAFWGCAFVLVVVGTASLMPLAWCWLGGADRNAEKRIEQQVVDSMYEQLSDDPELKASVTSMYASVDFNHTDMENVDNTLEPGDTLILYLNFRQDAAGNEQSLPPTVPPLMQAAKAAGWNLPP